jgi:Fe-S cluster biogenesis protein NfuA
MARVDGPGVNKGGKDAKDEALARHDRVLGILTDVLAPLVRADGGELYLVKITGDDVHVHLAGACSGCPGASVTRDRILAPLVTGVLSGKARVVLTTGVRIPEGATKIESP